VNLIHAVVYGIIQGFTAYLPISSDAHIRLIQFFLGWGADESPEFTAFTAVIQLGPTLAVVIYFWKDIVPAVTALFAGSKANPHDSKLAWGVVVGTIPIVILGLLLQKHIETTFRSLYWIGFSLIAIAVVMFIADRGQKGTRGFEDVKVTDGIFVGLWQCLALIPGMSRSGSTIVGSLFQGFKRETAAHFAFLLGIPSFTAAGIYELAKYHKALLGHYFLMPLVVSLIISGFVAYGCLKVFLEILQKRGVAPFVIYRIVLGVLILGLVKFGVVQPDAGANPLDTSAVSASSSSQ
jgi:undecaprenyl-diphosphatase